MLRSTAAAAFLAICLGPYAARLGSPSLYADDLVRVSQLQNGTLGGIVFVPFNEHIAPLFQSVGWVCWRVAGGRLARTPLVFTLASFLPFLPTLGLLVRLVRRETGSGTAALACLAVFSLSWLSIETVYWYSASSFMWALLATLAAWLFTASAAEGPRGRIWRSGIPAALATSAAPAFSAIGLLAGPVAAIRALAVGRWRAALAPMAGTLFTLALYAAVHDRVALASNVGQSAGVVPGLIAAARAPAAALVPALFGLRTWGANSGAVVVFQVALTALALAGLLFRAYRGHDRALLLGGLVLIFGGYVLTFCARAGEPGRALLETQRYHLFPMLGLLMLLAPFFRKALARHDAHPFRGLLVVNALAVVLLASHSAEMKGRARFLRFPDQARTLAAIDRLGAVCERAGVAPAHARMMLDPIETAWTPVGYNPLILIPPGRESSRVRGPRVKSTLLAALTRDERCCLCGGMDATPYLRPESGPSTAVAGGRRVALYHVRESGEGRYVSSGWPSFIEYELSGSGSPVALELSGPGPVDVWWRGDRQRWSETRSVRLRPAPSHPSGACLLPLDQVPHWDPSEARRIRLLYHAPGPIAVAAPRLVR